MSQVCSEPKCVSLTGPSGRCAVHAAGYARHSGHAELRCDTCRRELLKDEWYRTVGGVVEHVKSCKPHPDVMRERAAALAKL
jgi:hypothetical protein